MQADLLETDSFIADSGSDVVYVWHGPRADLATRYLVTRVAKAFVDRMNITSPLAVAASPIDIIHVESTQEPAEFTALFKSWDCTMQRPAEQRMLEYFEPSKVPEKDDFGRVALPEPPKPVKPAAPVETAPTERTISDAPRPTDGEVAANAKGCCVMM